MANNHVHEQIKTRLGSSVVLMIDGDATSFRGKLTGVAPAGTDNSDGGLATTGNDDVTVTIRVNRLKS